MTITVEIDSIAYDTYSTVATADQRLNASITSQAVAWRAATTDNKARALVEATRWIDEQDWKGTKTDDLQALAWPRDGVGVTGIEDGEVPIDIINASIELGALFVADVDLKSTLQQTATKRLKAGSVEIEYFRGSSVSTNTAFPKSIMAYVRRLLASSDSDWSGTIGYGIDRESGLVDDYGFNEGIQ